MKTIMKFIKSMFGGYTGSTGPEGSGASCECKLSKHSGKFGPG